MEDLLFFEDSENILQRFWKPNVPTLKILKTYRTYFEELVLLVTLTHT